MIHQAQLAEAQQDEHPSSRHEQSRLHPFWDFWGPMIFTLVLYLGVREMVAEARYIPSGSMLPGLQINDRLLIEKLTFRRRSPQRGEIIVFNSPYAFDPILSSPTNSSPLRCAIANFPLLNLVPNFADAACDAYIKRVVAIDGDRVMVNPRGELNINGKLIDEPYVTQYCHLDIQQQDVSPCRTLGATVPKGHVLVLGDNRGNSWDSRFWPGGPFLPKREIFGRAVFRFWPPNRIGPLSLSDHTPQLDLLAHDPSEADLRQS